MSDEIITRPVSTPCPVCGSCDVEGFVVKETETLFMNCYNCGWENETCPHDWEWYDDYPEDKPNKASE